MWLVDKYDSIYFPTSVFIGKREDEYFLYTFAKCDHIKNTAGIVEFKYNEIETYQTDEIYFVDYNPIHKVILAKHMYKVCQGIKRYRNIDIYYYPKSIKFTSTKQIYNFLKEVINDKKWDY